MATFEHIKYTSLTELVSPFRSENGLGDIDMCTRTLTGYTMEPTPFTFTVVLSSLDNTNIGPSLNNLIWDLGDGTTAVGVSVTKQYQYPGEYEITTIFTDQNGQTYKNKLSQKIKVINYIPDSLMWYTETIADSQGGKPEICLAGRPSEPLTIYRTNSWQTWPTVSGDGGYHINLYAQGSRSRPITQDQYWSNADTHLVPGWRFVESKESTVPVERVQTENNEYIYVKVQDGELVRAESTDSSAFFAGTSGAKTVHYLDDMANRLTSTPTAAGGGAAVATFANANAAPTETQMADVEEAKDLIAFASFDTSKFPVTENDHDMPKYELLKKDYFQVYETQKVGMPIRVKFNLPTSLNVSSNGIREMGITPTKFAGSPFSMTVRLQGDENFLLTTDDLVPLSSRWSAPTTAFSAQDTLSDIVTSQGFLNIYLSGTDTTFTRLTEPYKSDEDFKTWDVGTIYPDKLANSSVIVLLVDQESTSEYPPVVEPPRAININFSELVEEQQQVLLNSNLNDFYYNEHDPESGGRARVWITKQGKRYRGYISEKSKFQRDQALEMDVVDVTESYNTPGTYMSFINLEADRSVYDENKYKIVVNTLIDPPKYYNNEVLYYYITNPSNDTIQQVKPVYYREYSYGENGSTQTYTPPIVTKTPGNSGMYGIAVDVDGNATAVDGDTDKIIRYVRNMDIRAEISIRDLLPEDVRAKHYPDDEDAYGYTPSSISLDKNNDYWITLYDTISTIKVDGVTNEIVAAAVPEEHNFMANTRTTSPSSHWVYDSEYSINEVGGRPGEYGESIINPSVVETCRNNDIVVTYTNPLCSFIARYSPTGERLYKYEFPGEDRYFPGGVCVDVHDHIWAVTESTGLDYNGNVINGPLSGTVISFDEKLNIRHTIESLSGTIFQDMLLPARPQPETIEYVFVYDQVFDFKKQKYIETALMLEDDFSFTENPPLVLYEGNTYVFKNKYWNGGEHQLELREATRTQLDLPNSTPVRQFSNAGDVLLDTDGLSGKDTDVLSLTITKDTPPRMLLIDKNYPDIKCVLDVIKIEVKNTRPDESFDMINNPTFLQPDNENNVWFSWGSRFISRYNVSSDRIDTTLAVGSAYDDPRYHPLSAELYDRRDNAGRRSAIEGLGMDTANNILVINNADKRIYAMNSDRYVLSAFVNIDSTDIPYENFSWVPSISSNNFADEDTFMLYSTPSSYMTEEQMLVFFNNTQQFTGTSAQKLSAYNRYYETIVVPEVELRTAHGAAPVSATGFESEICANGDWTGYNWINKYDNRVVETDETTGFVSVTGESNEFTLLPRRGTHEIVKLNENKDFAGTLRSYMKQSNLRNSSKLYNEMMDAIFGTEGSPVESIGKRVYEKISNYLENHSDIDVCTIESLYGLAQMVNYNLMQVQPSMPAEIQRLMDILSINFTKMRGTRTNFQQDFEKYGNLSQKTIGVNLGPELLIVKSWMAGEYRDDNIHVIAVKNFDQSIRVTQKPGGELSVGVLFDEYVREGMVRVLKGGDHIHTSKSESLTITLDHHSYATNDFVEHNGKYYESVRSVPVGVEPSEHTTEYWREWTDGLVRSQHIDRVKQIYRGLSAEELQQAYEKLPIIIKLIKTLRVDVDKKLVFKEEHTGEYSLVNPMVVSFEDGRTYGLQFVNDTFKITDPNSRSTTEPEYMSSIEYAYPMFTINDDSQVISLIGTPTNPNPTIQLFKDRLYTFEIDSPGHPVIITTGPGLCAQPAENFVSNQSIEYGKILIRTDDHPVHGPIPKHLYYQSVKDPKISGKITVTDVKDVPHYSTLYGGVTSYELDIDSGAHNNISRFGWGLSFPETANVWQYYSMFEYLPDANDEQNYVNNVIDWDAGNYSAEENINPSGYLSPYGRTTISYNTSGYNEWTQDGGLMDIMFEKTLREGLRLFDGIDSIDKYTNETLD